MQVILRALILFIRFLELAIVARVFLSWLPMLRDNQIVRFIYQVTEPVIRPFRNLTERFMYERRLTVDFSPFLALIFLWLARIIIGNLINWL